MKKWTKLTIVILILVYSQNAHALAASFSDLQGHWAYKDIMQMVARGVVSGFPDETFQPEAEVTRAQFIKLVVEGLGQGEEASQLEQVASRFKDVSEDHWAKAYIEAGVELGITRGYDDGKFYPESPITRQEMAVMVLRALHWENRQREFSGNRMSFADQSQIAAWAGEGVDIMSRVGIMSGFPDGRFGPGEWTTRAQASVVVKRLMEEKGTLLDFTGRVESMDTESDVLTISKGEQQTVQLSLASDRLIYYKNQSILPGDLHVGAPVQGMINEGEIVFLEIIPEGGKVLAAPVENPEVEPDPVRSSRVTQEEIGALVFKERYGRDGFGTTIAIIDTGIDASHPDLQWTSQQQGKIIDWVDFTGEGNVSTVNIVKEVDGELSTSWGDFQVGDIASKSGQYHMGFLEERSIGTKGTDLNLNGSNRDRIFVLVTDSQKRHEYTAVYVDHDNDRDFSDEESLHVFRDSRQVGFLGTDHPETESIEQTSFVVTEIDQRGNGVNLGFDMNGHGTHVAATAGGFSASSIGMTGVAPGVQLMALKVADVDGQASWEGMMEALDYAAKQGAAVINISIGDKILANDGTSEVARKIDQISERYGVIVVAAAGNDGPGLNTAATPGDAQAAISVGAFVSPAMWQTDYNYQVDETSLWSYSALGPKKNGALFPQVVAPGSVVSAVPIWKKKGYELMEGTSMAAPHVSGAVALLLEQARIEKMDITPSRMQKALEMGADALRNIPVAAQGFGRINVSRAWHHLKRLTERSPLVTAMQTYPGLIEAPGLYARDYKPGKLYFTLKNESDEDLHLSLSGQQDWLQPEVEQVYLPAHSQREIGVDYQITSYASSLCSGLIIGDDPSFYGWELSLPVTIAVPEDLEMGTDMILGGRLGAAQFDRYYFRVPDGMDELSLTLSIPQDNQDEYEGRARMHIINPDGEQVKLTYYAGLDFDGVGHEAEETVINHPESGVWEVAVYSSATLSLYGHDDTRYLLGVKTAGNEVIPLIPLIDPSKPKLYVETFMKERITERPGFITVRVRDSASLKPVNIFLTIDDTVYAIKDGLATIPLAPGQQPKQLKILDAVYQYVEMGL